MQSGPIGLDRMTGLQSSLYQQSPRCVLTTPESPERKRDMLATEAKLGKLCFNFTAVRTTLKIGSADSIVLTLGVQPRAWHDCRTKEVASH